MIPAFGTPIPQWYPQFREQVLQDSHIVNVTALENVLGAQYQTGSFLPEGALEDYMQQIPLLDVTYDFIETFNMEMVAGRTFVVGKGVHDVFLHRVHVLLIDVIDTGSRAIR